mmetsp:Transcript_7110/g.8217  ORF Transcript_7110/g.8217 Transcript_7110/m.8217 type:complete len:154 (+) Transcript_7110:210-671(+)
MRVLYLHGLEETADSPKPRALLDSQGLEVLTPALEIFFTKRHSPLVYLLQQRWFLACVLAGTVLPQIPSYLARILWNRCQIAVFAPQVEKLFDRDCPGDSEQALPRASGCLSSGCLIGGYPNYVHSFALKGARNVYQVRRRVAEVWVPGNDVL